MFLDMHSILKSFSVLCSQTLQIYMVLMRSVIASKYWCKQNSKSFHFTSRINDPVLVLAYKYWCKILIHFYICNLSKALGCTRRFFGSRTFHNRLLEFSVLKKKSLKCLLNVGRVYGQLWGIFSAENASRKDMTILWFTKTCIKKIHVYTDRRIFYFS